MRSLFRRTKQSLDGGISPLGGMLRSTLPAEHALAPRPELSPERTQQFRRLHQGLQQDLAQPAYGSHGANFWGNLLGTRRADPVTGNTLDVTPAWATRQFAALRPASMQGSNVQEVVRPARTWGQWGRDVGGAVAKTIPAVAARTAILPAVAGNAALRGDTGPLMSTAYDVMRPLNAALDIDVLGNVDMRSQPRWGNDPQEAVANARSLRSSPDGPEWWRNARALWAEANSAMQPSLANNPAGPRHLLFGHQDRVFDPRNQFSPATAHLGTMARSGYGQVPSTTGELAAAHAQAAADPATTPGARISHNALSGLYGTLPTAAGLASARYIPGLRGFASAAPIAANPVNHLALAGVMEAPTGNGGRNVRDLVADTAHGIRQIRTPASPWLHEATRTLSPGLSAPEQEARANFLAQLPRDIGAAAIEALPYTAAQGAGGLLRPRQILGRMLSSQGSGTAVTTADRMFAPGNSQMATATYGLPSDDRRAKLFAYNNRLQQALAENAQLPPAQQQPPEVLQQSLIAEIFGR